MAKTTAQRYGEHNRKTGKVITPNYEKKDVVSDDGRIRVEVGYDETPISTQYPFPTNGDSIYANDIDLFNSDIGDFSGSILTLFDDYRTVNTANELSNNGANPKTLKIAFDRPVISSFIGIGSANTSLSNAVVIVRGLDEQIIKTVDSSLDSTKRGVVIAQFEQSAFIEVEIQFHTDDEVSIGGIFIQKSSYVTIGAIDGLIPFGNSSVVPLLAGETFTSDILDTKNYGIILVSCFADVACAIDGLVIEFSTDKINWRWSDTYTPEAGKAKSFSVQPQARYLRTRFINGLVDQTIFDIQTQLKPVYIKPSSHRIKDVVSGEDDSELVKAAVTGISEVSGLPENVSTFRGSLSTSDGLRHRVGLNLKFHQPDTVSTTLAVATLPGDISITVVDSTGFIQGMDIEIYSGSVTGELFFRITVPPVGNVITLDQPIPIALPIGNPVENTILNMNVLGTLISPQIFYIGPPAGSIWQLTRLLISMTDTTAMDDGTFGGRTALPNGVLIRQFTNGEFGNAAIWKTNGEIAGDMYDTSYVPKPPAGTGYGFRARWTLQAMEAVVELNGDTGDQLQILVQDDLTGLVSFNMKSQGRLYGG